MFSLRRRCRTRLIFSMRWPNGSLTRQRETVFSSTTLPRFTISGIEMPAIPVRPRPDLNPRPPRFQPPPGATDTHFHIFGPEDRYPFVQERRFTPPDASVEEYVHLHRTLGLSRAVLVQPSSYGTDNRRQLEAAKAMDFPTRLIVVVPPGVSDRELDDLYAAGARGVRFNPSQPGSLPLS